MWTCRIQYVNMFDISKLDHVIIPVLQPIQLQCGHAYVADQ